MELAICIAFTLFLGLADSAPITKNRRMNVTRDFFPESLAIYTTKHEIVNVAVILGVRNFDRIDDIKGLSQSSTIFFALADIGPNGEKDYKGLYMFKHRVATKLLDNGTYISTESPVSNVAYFGASDGIYKYNAADNKAEKYGNLTDSVIQLAKVNGSDIIYILTVDRQLYNVTEGGTKKTRVDGVTDPREMALDNSNNLYYVGADNKPYVLTADGIREITGFSSNASYTKLIRPPFMLDDCMCFISGDDVNIIFKNGTSLYADTYMQVKPSAYSIDAVLLQYYGYDKKIYEYDLGSLIVDLLEQLGSYFETWASNVVQNMTTKFRNEFLAITH